MIPLSEEPSFSLSFFANLFYHLPPLAHSFLLLSLSPKAHVLCSCQTLVFTVCLPLSLLHAPVQKLSSVFSIYGASIF